MKQRNVILSFLLVVAVILVAGCLRPTTPSSQVILVGESFASGAEAVREANNFIGNAAGSGCKAISVGGYGAGGEGLIIGVPVLLDCPLGTQLLPNGDPVPPSP